MARSLLVFWKRHFQGKYQRHADVMFLLLLPCTLLTLTSLFMTALECIQLKQVYNSTWIALLKHGFVLVKTWLLIACGTGFYAIIAHKHTLNVIRHTWRIAPVELTYNYWDETRWVPNSKTNTETLDQQKPNSWTPAGLTKDRHQAPSNLSGSF